MTKADRNTQIIARFLAGERLRSIGECYGITVARVRQIAQEHGCEARGIFRVVTDAHLEFAAPKVARGFSIAHVADQIGQNPNTLYCALVRNNLYAPWGVQKAWAEPEVAFLKANYRRLPATKIADRLGRTKNEVIGKACRLGLCQPLHKQNVDRTGIPR